MDVLTRLGRRAAAVDPLLKDGALALLLLGVASWELMGGQDALIAIRRLPPQPGLVPLAALMILPVTLRRRWPLAGWALAVAGWTLAVLLAHRFGLTFASAAALLVLAYSAGAHGGLRRISLPAVVLGSLLAFGALALPARLGGVGDLVGWLSPALVPITLWLAGDAVRGRRLRAARERDAGRRDAVAAERARIARELHDVVGHAVTVMVVQAEAARRQLSRRPDRAAEALRTVSATGNEALAELRHLLAVLDGGDGPEAVEPEAGLAWLEPLLERVRAAGVTVDLRRDGPPSPLPRGLDVTAYRIVQEALTNVLRHAGRAGAEVRLGYTPDRLTIEVADGGPGARRPGGEGGRGLLGMRERVAAYGGELEAGPRPGGGFRVRALLPLGEDG